MPNINYNRPFFSKSDIKKITSSLKNGSLTEGDFLRKYELEIKKFSNCKYSVAVNSATSALHLSCLALGLKKGDHLWTSANSFVASANCGLYCDAKVKLIDINKKNWNLDLNILEDRLKISKKNKTSPKILVNVFFGGLSNYPEDVQYLSRKYNFKIIDDASHAFGSKFKNEFIGNCKYSDITVFSTHPVKMFTTCEGGIINTNDNQIFEKVSSLRSHGIFKEKKQFVNKSEAIYPWYFEQKLLGFNYRLNEIESIIGISQIKKINSFVKTRNKIATNYKRYLDKNLFSFQEITSQNESSYHLFVVRVRNFDLNKSLKLFKELLIEKIRVQKHYIPIYKHPYFQKILTQEKNEFTQTENYYKECVSLPIYVSLKSNDIARISKILNEAVKKILS